MKVMEFCILRGLMDLKGRLERRIENGKEKEKVNVEFIMLRIGGSAWKLTGVFDHRVVVFSRNDN